MRLLLLFLSILLILPSCEQKQESPLPPEKNIRLHRAEFTDLKDWSQDKQNEAANAFNNSCIRILEENNPYLSNAAAHISAAAYQDICRRFIEQQPQASKHFRKFIEDNFTPYLVTDSKNNPEGKFTSYYESALNASYRQSEKYRYPVYGKPHDLVEFNPRDFDAKAPSKTYVGRVQSQKLVPYFTRGEIDSGKINAPVILWADSKIDINFMQIQGSAVATLDDGSKVRVGFAGSNGHPFRGIGSILLEKKLLKPGEASMIGIKKWLQNNPDKADEIYNQNKRFVFHRLLNTEGPIGAHGVPLTAGRSLAVDRSYIPLGSLLWLETTGPDKENIHKLVIAQDIGSAIKGPVRGDYFWGSGSDDVLAKAGSMNSTGQYYIFIPKTKEQSHE